MDAYLGIDIGTTNSKCMIVGENGRILSVSSSPTPRCSHSGYAFFDIKGIERIADTFIHDASSRYRVRSVGFSSIGESVVPVASGHALFDAVMWDAHLPSFDGRTAALIEKLCPLERMGTSDNGLFSIHKILWMLKTIPELNAAEGFLPVSSYLAYRATGRALWDYSQAARSFMFSIESRDWIEELFDILPIPHLAKIAPMGSAVGSSDGIIYGLGGHDHIVGMYGIEKIFASKASERDLFYTSMGTSEVMAALCPWEKAIHCTDRKGHVIPSSVDIGIVTRSFRMFGRFLSRVMDMLAIPGFREMNELVGSSSHVMPGCLFSCGGDFTAEEAGPGEINILRIKENCSRAGIAESAYLYMAVLSEILRKHIRSSASLLNDSVIVAGGKITGNELFMRYLATAFDSPVFILDTPEISALGAVMTGISALGAESAMRSLTEETGISEYLPDDSLSPAVRETEHAYERLMLRKDGHVSL